MRKLLVLFLMIYRLPCHGLGQAALPTVRILSEDIVQDSIRQVRFAKTHFAILWTYTEVGAKKMLTFWHAHSGTEVLTQIGNFEARGMIALLESSPPTWTDDGWLKHPTDKFTGVDDDHARKIVAGLSRR